MDFIRSTFEKMNLCSVLIWKKTGEKSVQLVRSSFFRKYFLWNPYFSLRVCSCIIGTKFNIQIRAGQHLKGFDQPSLSGACRGNMPPWLKTKQNTVHLKLIEFTNSWFVNNQGFFYFILGKEYILTATIANIRYKKHCIKMFSPIGISKVSPSSFYGIIIW